VPVDDGTSTFAPVAPLLSNRPLSISWNHLLELSYLLLFVTFGSVVNALAEDLERWSHASTGANELFSLYPLLLLFY